MRIVLATCTGIVATFWGTSIVSGQTFWQGTTGNWFTASNWTQGVPNPASPLALDAVISNGGTAQIPSAGANVRRLRVGGSAGAGNLQVNGGTLSVVENLHLNEAGTGLATFTIQGGGTASSPSTILGFSATGTSTATVSGTNSRLTSDALTVGASGQATLNINTGGTVFVTNNLAINSLSAVNVNGGTLRFNTIGGLGGINKVQLNSGTIQLAGNRQINFDSTISALFGVVGGPLNATAIASGKKLVVEGSVTLGRTADITFEVNGGSFTSQGLLTIGTAFQELGTLVVKNGGTASNSGVVFGADPELTGYFNRGAAIVTGTGSTWTTGNISVGSQGDGTLEIRDGGNVISGSVSLADGGNSALITGAGSSWTSNSFYISGSVIVSDNALLEVAQNLNIGTISSVTLSGGTLKVGSLTRFFNPSDPTTAGKFNFFGGTLRLTGDRDIGLDGSVAVALGNSPTLHTGQGLHVEGTATLMVPVLLDGGALTVGKLANPSLLDFQRGALNVTNQAVSISPSGLFGDTLELRDNSLLNVALGIQNQGIIKGQGRFIGPLTNSASGSVRAAAGKQLRFSGSSFNNSGLVEAIGTSADLAELEFDSPVTNASSTGLITGRNGILRFRQGLTNQGSLALTIDRSDVFGDVNNTGSIVVSGGAEVTFYDDILQNGTFRVSKVGTTTSTAVVLGAFSGAGGSSGGGNIFFEGDLRPGNSPAIVTFDNNIGLGSGSKTTIEIGGTIPGSQHDQLSVAGSLTLGGSLEVSLINGFLPTSGLSFDVLDWGTLSGSFSSISLPTLGGVSWDLSQLYTTGTLRTIAGIPGDFDADGDVDGRDFLLWQRNPPIGNLADWQANFGAPVVSTISYVPEPASTIFAAGLLLMTPVWHGRRTH